MYQAYQAHSDFMWPFRVFAKTFMPAFADPLYGLGGNPSSKKIAAALDVFVASEVTHHRRPFAIDSVMVDGVEVAVTEETAAQTPFATLLHFRKDVAVPQPRVLVVAPMSGHFATLLRETVRTMLQDHDVYITDWHNARDVPLSAGRFGLDEYTEHLIDFMTELGPRSHLMAICQPCVSALSAVALMSEDDHPATPASLTLMAGPIDCRISPTAVNDLAVTKPIDWFEKNLVSRVPFRYPGAMREVYPGFMQLTAFISMNKDRHVDAFKEMYANLRDGDFEKARVTRNFYDEYFAVADLPAEFYLETVRAVFQEYLLPKGELTFRGRAIDCSKISKTSLLTVEGERDDICAIGQTMAAHDLCTKLPKSRRANHVQAGVGHYGVFSGRRWNNEIYPVVREAIRKSA